MKKILIAILTLIMSGCMSPDERLQSHADNVTSYADFGICSGYGCRTYHPTGLTANEWDKISGLFGTHITNPEEERQVIAMAIALIEQIIGVKTGTDNDKAKAVPINFSTKGQMDCIDEAINSTTYLYLMRKFGLIKFHTLGTHARRNLNDMSYPHSSATIYEIGQKKIELGDGHFVVDSWFHKNGAPAEILPVRQWKERWYPETKLDVYNFSAS